MKKIINKISYCLVLSLVLFIFISNVSAASIGLSVNKSTVYVGDSFIVTISGINGKVSISSSNNVSLNISGTQFVEGTMTITGTAKSTGNANITVSPIDVTTNNANPVEVTEPNKISINIIEKVQNNTPPAVTNSNNNVQTNNISNTNKNNNAYLSKLQVNQEGLTPNFNKNKTSYAITVGENVSTLNVTAVPEASTSKVSISGNTNLKNGDNKIYITVTAQDGTKKVYTITVTKTADPEKSNSYLKNLIVENATMSPEFSKEILEYDCGVVGASIQNLKILTFGENENVKIEITGNDELVEGDNTIKVKVTSEDGTTVKEYVIKVKKDSSLVEENNIEEINALQDTDNDKFPKNILNKIKSNWLLVLMYVVIIVEFIQIVYLYKHRDKNKVGKIKNADKKTKKEVMDIVNNDNNNMTLDKQFKHNKKIQKKMENLDFDVNESTDNNTTTNNVKKRTGATKFNDEN